MSSLSYANRLMQTPATFFNTVDLGMLLNISNKRTLENVSRKLIKEGILIKLEKGKYFITNHNPNDFAIAQFLYSPSYISFETALNYHGILSQFPFEITSTTTKTKVEKNINNKMYSYYHINKKLFTGYYITSSAGKYNPKYLIALPEKALLDYLYMICKSLRSETYLHEMDFSSIKKYKIQEYIELVPDTYKKRINQLVKQYINI